MRNRIFLFIALFIIPPLFLNACAPSRAIGPSQTGHHLSLRQMAPERIYKKGEWALLLFVIDRGSRSQGVHGELYHKGRPITGRKGETLDTPMGRLSYHGPELERRKIWEISGWTLSDQTGVLAPHHAPPKRVPTRQHPIGMG